MRASTRYWQSRRAASCSAPRWRTRSAPAWCRCASPALPGTVREVCYALEYGQDALQVQAGALAPGARVLLVDDVLATGGTLAAACALAQQLQAEIAGAGVLLELSALGGRTRWTVAAPLHAALVA